MTKRNQITVTISGKPLCGKSTLGMLIAGLLVEKGCYVERINTEKIDRLPPYINDNAKRKKAEFEKIFESEIIFEEESSRKEIKNDR